MFDLCFNDVSNIFKFMKVVKEHGFVGYLHYDEDFNKFCFIIEYKYKDLKKVDTFIFSSQVLFNKHFKTFYHEWLGEYPEDDDICRLIINLKY